MAIIRIKLDVSKVRKDALFKGKSGTYLDVTLLENRGGTDQYGNDFLCVQDLGKEARERGEKGPILGNAKFVGQKSQGGAQQAPAQATTAPAQSTANTDDTIPF
jgi:hypothetical protein